MYEEIEQAAEEGIMDWVWNPEPVSVAEESRPGSAYARLLELRVLIPLDVCLLCVVW